MPNGTPPSSATQGGMTRPGHFRVWPLILGVLCAMLAIALFSRWYARDVTLPRYCEDPEQALVHLRQVLEEGRPAEDGSRRPYITAARLLFLVPRRGDEPVDAYLGRLRAHLAQACR